MRRLETMKAALCDELLDIRQLALGDVAFDEIRIHPVEAENDQLLRERAVRSRRAASRDRQADDEHAKRQARYSRRARRRGVVSSKFHQISQLSRNARIIVGAHGRTRHWSPPDWPGDQ